jgi:hypothetical protein
VGETGELVGGLSEGIFSSGKLAERVGFEPLSRDLQIHQQSKALRLMVTGLERRQSAAIFVFLKVKTAFLPNLGQIFGAISRGTR